MSYKQYNENFINLKYHQKSHSLIPIQAKSKKDKLKKHNKIKIKGEKGSLEEFNDEQTKDEDVQGTRGQQDDEKPNNIDETGSSQDSNISVLRFRSFVLQISGLDGESYTAIQKILAMDAISDSEESIVNSNRENGLITPLQD